MPSLTAILHAALYTSLAFLGWLALVAAVGVLIHGRAWVWDRTLEATGLLAWRWRRRRERLKKAMGPRPDRPLTSSRRALQPAPGAASRRST